MHETFPEAFLTPIHLFCKDGPYFRNCSFIGGNWWNHLGCYIKNNNQPPQPRQSSAGLFHAEWFKGGKEMQSWHPGCGRDNAGKARWFFWQYEIQMDSSQCIWILNALQACSLVVPWKMPLRFLKIVHHGGLRDLQSIWVLSFCISLSGLSPSVLYSSCVSVTFKNMNFLLQSQEVLACCCWGKGTWNNYALENRTENISGGEKQQLQSNELLNKETSLDNRANLGFAALLLFSHSKRKYKQERARECPDRREKDLVSVLPTRQS